LFVKALLPSGAILCTNTYRIDVAVAGNAKHDTGYKNILTDERVSDSLLIESIGSHFDQKVTFGVADGVGGWGKIAGNYSSTLVHNIAASSAESPLEMIRDGYHKTDKVASTTICVATIDQGHLIWANLGDSGLRVLRNKQFQVKTKEQQHIFNFPYQLGKRSMDCPDDCDRGVYRLEKRDVMIMGTDGLFDNLDGSELISLINPDHSAKEIIDRLAKKAIENSRNLNKTSPFSEKSMHALGIQSSDYKSYQGGKQDDISIVVAVVK